MKTEGVKSYVTILPRNIDTYTFTEQASDPQLEKCSPSVPPENSTLPCMIFLRITNSSSSNQREEGIELPYDSVD